MFEPPQATPGTEALSTHRQHLQASRALHISEQDTDGQHAEIFVFGA